MIEQGSRTSSFSAGKIAKNIVSLLASNLGVTFAGFLISLMMARYLGDELYGKYVFVLSVAMLMLAVADLGLQKIATREIAKDITQSGVILFTAFVLRLVGYIVMGVLFLSIAPLLSDEENMRSITALVVVIVISLGLIDVLNSVFIGHERMEFDLWTRLSERLIEVALVSAAIAISGDLQLIVAVVALSSVIGVMISMYNARRFINLSDLRFSPMTAKMLLRSGLPMGASLLIFAFYSRFDVLLLGVIRSAAEVAWFSIAYTLVVTVSALATAGSQAFFPVFSRMLRDERDEALDLLQTALRYSFIISVVAAGGLFVIAHPLILTVYGEAFARAGDVLAIMAFSLIFMLPTQLLFVLLLSDNRQTWVMYINLTGAVLLLCINPAFIIWMGVEGAALTNVLIEAFVLVLYVRLTRSTLGWVGLAVFKPLLTGAVSIALYVFLPFDAIINLGIGTVFFVSTLFLFDIVRQQDIALLRETMASRRRKTGES